ncbi:MAG: hypothetical protein JJV93_00425 [Alphaproteobacteria bacterium]|nr:hypothetical protein [Alphaproteobacteria bacterium]MBL0717720.1 hypothetical protein [Alphaproteobacteria bacterium]
MRLLKAMYFSILAVLITSCSMSPMYKYGDKKNDMTIAKATQQLYIEPIHGELGIIIRNRIRLKLNPKGIPSNPKYTMSISLKYPSDLYQGEQSDGTFSFVSMFIEADVNINDKKTGKLFTSFKEKYQTSYYISSSLMSSTYAKKDAEERMSQTIADLISQRTALYFNHYIRQDSLNTIEKNDITNRNNKSAD